MDAEERLKSKEWFKVFMILLKFIPMIISFLYAFNTFGASVNIDIPVISNIAGVSLFTWIFMYVASQVFRFCLYHRMFLYYILVVDIINIADYYINIPIPDFEVLMLHGIISCLCLFIILYSYVKSNKRLTIKNNK